MYVETLGIKLFEEIRCPLGEFYKTLFKFQKASECACTKGKKCCDVTLSRQEGSLTCHLNSFF